MKNKFIKRHKIDNFIRDAEYPRLYPERYPSNIPRQLIANIFVFIFFEFYKKINT
jgi:hypothetical protein